MVRGVAVDLQFEKKALGEKGVAQNELGLWGKMFYRPRALPAGPGQAEPPGNVLAYLENSCGNASPETQKHCAQKLCPPNVCKNPHASGTHLLRENV